MDLNLNTYLTTHSSYVAFHMNISSEIPHNTKSSSKSGQAISTTGLSREVRKKELSIDQAVRILKRNFRTYVRRQGILSSAALSDYKLLCKRDIVEGMPKAADGKTSVYLPESHPEIVLKESGLYSKQRYCQMYLIRKELKKLGCSHLIVPRALPVEGFLIEERLPITANSFDNMGLYWLQPEIFDEAVREMVKISAELDLTSDILDLRRHPLSKNAGVDYFVRYDNLPLYKVSIDGVEQGRIGLIDLEHAKPTDDKTLISLARLFPLHYDIIKDEADRCGISCDDELLKMAANDGHKYLASGFADHYQWLQEKNVLSSSREWSIELSPQRMVEINNAVVTELLSMNEGKTISRGHIFDPVNVPAGFLKDGVKSAEKLAQAITIRILENFNKQIEGIYYQHIHGKTSAEVAGINLVKLRTYFDKKDKITSRAQYIFLDSCDFNTELFKCYFWLIDGVVMAEKLADVIFAELAKGQEIFHYDPTNYAGSSRYSWIRY